jgi:hypothetical protein
MASRFDTDEMRPAPPQTEDSKERGFTPEKTPPDFGTVPSEDLEPDPVSDIADETPGHRG